MKNSENDKNLFFRAYIWDPSQDEIKSPCTIIISNGEPIKIQCWKKLKIFESLFRDLNFHEPLPCLFGETEEGNPFTVYNIKLDNYKSGIPIPKIELISEIILIGGSLNLEQLKVERIYLKNQYLEEWANLTPISVKSIDKKEINLKISIDFPKDIKLCKTPEYTVKLSHSISYPLQKVNNYHINLNPKLYFIFKTNISFLDAFKFRESIKILFQLIINIECGILETEFKLCDEIIPTNVYVFENRVKWNYQKLSKRNVLFDLKNFLPFSQIVIENWHRIFSENKDSIKEYYRISMSRNLVNKREIFINAIHGLEMYYKIFYKPTTEEKGKMIKLEKKITTFFNELDQLSNKLLPEKDKTIKRIIATRNHFAHYNLTSRESDPNIIPKNILGAYSRRIEIFNDFVLLYILGVPKEILVERFKKHVHYFVYKNQNYIFK